jgi:hypothetical protein
MLPHAALGAPQPFEVAVKSIAVLLESPQPVKVAVHFLRGRPADYGQGGLFPRRSVQGTVTAADQFMSEYPTRGIAPGL